MCIISQTMCTSDHIIFLFPASKCQNGCLFLCQAVETCLTLLHKNIIINSWRCLMFAIDLSCSVMQSLGSFLQIHGISWNLFVEPDFIYHCTLPFKFISSYIYSHLTMQFQILGYWFGLAVNIHRSYFETFFACQIK